MDDLEPALFDPLVGHPDFLQLQQERPAVNPMKILGLHDDEASHSRLLARIMSHKGPLAFGHAIWPALLPSLPAGPLGADLLEARFKGRAEYRDIDVLLLDEERKLLVAFETKIWDRERPGQISDYQKVLEERFPQWRGLFIFLTPGGRQPRTHNPESRFPCLPLAWASIREAVAPVREQDESGILRILAANIKENFMNGEEQNTRARALWANPDIARALDVLMKNRPNLGEIGARLVEGVNRFTGKNLTHTVYPSRGEIVEIKIFDTAWEELGLPVTYLFHHYKGYMPAARIFIEVESRKEFKSQLETIALLGKGVIDPDYTPIEDWKQWCRVFDEEEYPERHYITELAFDESTVQALLKKFQVQYIKLDNIMGKYKSLLR